MQKIIYIIIFLALSLLCLNSGYGQKEILSPNSYAFGFQQEQYDTIDSYKAYLALLEFNLHNKKNLRFNKNEYLFKLDSTIAFEPNENNIPTPISKGEHILEELKDIFLSWSHNLETESWNPKSFSVYHYDENNFLKTTTFNSWNGDYDDLSEENALLTRKYKYNDEGLLTVVTTQNWEDVRNDEFNDISLYQYDSTGMLMTYRYLASFSDPDTLLLIDTINYYYNDEKLLEDIVRWRISNGEWSYFDSIRFKYYPDGKILKENKFYWSANESSLVPEHEHIYYYNDDQSLDKITRLNSYDDTFNRWRSREIDYYSYNPFGSLDQILTYDSIPPYSYDYQLIYNSSFEFNEDISNDKILMPRRRIPHHQENHMISEESHHWESFISGGLDYKLVYYYSEFDPVSINNLFENIAVELLVYPNPSENYIRFKLPNYQSSFLLTVYDYQGRQVLKNYISNGQKVALSNLSQGLYFYHILVNDIIYSGTFVKQV